MSRFVSIVASLGVISTVAGAQGPRGADLLSPAAIADSQARIHELGLRLEKNQADAAAWHHQGMIAWALADRARAADPPRTLDAARLDRLADSSLRIAAELEPADASFPLAAGQFLLATGSPAKRLAAGPYFQKAVDAARKGGDPFVHAEAAVELGRAFWRRYDRVSHRRIETVPGSAVRSISEALQPMSKVPEMLLGCIAPCPMPMGTLKDIRTSIENQSYALRPEFSGTAEFAEALQLFREAYAAAPTNPRAFRNVAMALADKSSWTELQSFAHGHLKDHGWDPMAWMVLGLASHRRGEGRVAAAAFDTGLTNMTPDEHARFDRIERVLPKATATALGGSSPAQRTAYEQLYWHLYDPLWSQGGGSARSEFFARVTFAELRWTVDELHARGADTDRGDIYVRYGPPSIIAVFGPGVNANEAPDSENNSAESTTWIYDSGLLFVFSGQPAFGNAKTAVSDVQMINATIQAQPVRWDNINDLHIDSMPVQVARFRGGHDSVDLVIATTPPYADIVATDETKEPVQSQFWLSRGGITNVFHDSSDIGSARTLTWTRRVAVGNYLYRAEASASTSKHAGRAMAQVVADADPRSGFAFSGFGVSDLLVASAATPTGSNVRWFALNPSPLVGPAPRGGQLSLVWENYDFGQRAGAAQYAVTLTMTRDRSEAGRIAASIVGALTNLAKIDRQNDKTVISFDRSLPYSAAFADEIDLALGTTPAGFYTLTLEITDKISGRTDKRTVRLSISE